MRLKARTHLHYAPVAGGVYFSSARTQFVMRGPEMLFGVVDVCVSLLEAGATEDEMVAALRSERSRPVVGHLCRELRSHGMLLDLERLTVGEPTGEVRLRHPEALAHLESISDDPYAVFARLRAATVLLCGPASCVLPAARGLARAGVGLLILATSQPDDVAATAHRLGAEVVALTCEEIGRVGRAVQAVFICGDGKAAGAEDFVLGRDGGWLPKGVPVVPVWLDDRVVLAGPALREPAPRNALLALRDRVLIWAGAVADGAVPRPVADALVGALAGQMLFELLTEGAVAGEAHIVHGADLTTDRIVVQRPRPPGGAWRALADADAAATPQVTDVIEAINAISARWTGLFELAGGDYLPQLPLALRRVDYRTATPGTVIAWGSDQQAATVHVAVQALRELSTRDGIAAAGLTEERWLLDGALRLSTDSAQPLRDIAPDDLAPDTLRLWRGLRSYEPDPITARLLHIPGVDWHLGRVELTRNGDILGQGWAPSGAEAIHAAIGTALADAQIRQLDGRDRLAVALNTDPLTFADTSVISTLRKSVTEYAAANGTAFHGRPESADTAPGATVIWSGPVTLHQVEPGSAA
jgi:hypothetical protein